MVRNKYSTVDLILAGVAGLGIGGFLWNKFEMQKYMPAWVPQLSSMPINPPRRSNFGNPRRFIR